MSVTLANPIFARIIVLPERLWGLSVGPPCHGLWAQSTTARKSAACRTASAGFVRSHVTIAPAIAVNDANAANGYDL
jgi:hypothetical protein